MLGLVFCDTVYSSLKLYLADDLGLAGGASLSHVGREYCSEAQYLKQNLYIS